MKRFEEYLAWEEDQNKRKKEAVYYRRRRRILTREQKRQKRYDYTVAVTTLCLLIFSALLLILALSEQAKAATIETVVFAEDDGRLPGDDVPATVSCKVDTEDSIAYIPVGEFTVTHYCICERCCGKSPENPAYGITASGREADPGLSVAVDPSVITLGSTIAVDYGDGERHYYRADDTGSAISGKRMDVCMESHQAALEAGVKTAMVWVVEE